MPVSTIPNHRPQPRKQLCDQIDRLDTLLDGFADALNGSVVEAVRDGTRLAVKDAIIEILTDPSLRAKLHQAASPESAANANPSRPGLFARWSAKVRTVLTGIRGTFARAGALVVQRARGVAQTSNAGLQFVRTFGNLKALIVIALVVGGAAGAGTYFAPHTVAAALSGVSSGLAAISVQLGLMVRRAYRLMAAL